ncbi:MAG: winged helix-turn-helix transcriptional regulator [bacterium]|jgi:DNA-binding transcriptional ArsR family regulator
MLPSKFYAAVGDDVTYRIALLISRYRLSVKEIVAALNLSQPHVSHKLAKLRKYSCVTHVRLGRSVYYELGKPCREIFIAGDRMWREYHPESADIWNDDFVRLEETVPFLESRAIDRSILNRKPPPSSKVAK